MNRYHSVFYPLIYIYTHSITHAHAHTHISLSNPSRLSSWCTCMYCRINWPMCEDCFHLCVCVTERCVRNQDLMGKNTVDTAILLCVQRETSFNDYYIHVLYVCKYMVRVGLGHARLLLSKFCWTCDLFWLAISYRCIVNGSAGRLFDHLTIQVK